MSGFLFASTSLLRSQAQLFRLVDLLRGKTNNVNDGLLLYALSHNAPDLEQCVKKLSSCANETIGCISGLLPTEEKSPYFSCSVALLERDKCVPFSSLKTGEGPAQVGRWHAFRKQTADIAEDSGAEDSIDLNNIWHKDTKRYLPDELKSTTDRPGTFIYFSDHASYELASALHERFPRHHQLGFAASSTPFITGRPFTLLRNGAAQSSGAVGVSLSVAPKKISVQHSGLVRITSSLPVRRSEGNLIHELGDSAPAQILLKAIQDHGLPDAQAKEVEFYIGIRDATSGDPTSPAKLFRIVAGSPSRGSVALEEAAAPPVGSMVEFYYRRLDSPSALPRLVDDSGSLMFGALVENPELDSFDSSIDHRGDGCADEVTFDSKFLYSSEHGFIMTPHLGEKNSPLKCTVPGTFGALNFPSRR